MASCPSNSLQYNATLCACTPGHLYDSATNTCTLFQTSPKDWIINSGIDYSISFPVTIFSFDSIKKFTQSQAVLLESTLVLLFSWLLFCFVVRFGKIEDGKSVWFKVRWWISRLDVCYGTRHWLDDQKIVRKRKTELGGAFSIASWILFIGLFAAMLYQMISKRTVEVHNVKASNGPDLLSFINDMEFNITTISSMSCSHLRGLGTIVTGTPGFMDYRASPLSAFANYSCHNTSHGPTIMLKCSGCKLARDNLYISWQFVDLPNDPAMAVGFQFNFSAKNHNDRKHMTFITGMVRNGSNMDDRPITFRGPDVSILKFHLFPRIYRNLHDLRLIQPLFHEFIPGSSSLGESQLQASLQSSQDGLVNTTLAVNFVSAYIIEIDTENILQPVSFFADLGGLYAISFVIFFYLLMQCEYRIKKFRNEDSVLQNIRNRTKAKRNWDKLRKYVMFTWGCSSLEDASNISREGPFCCCIGRSGTLQNRKQNIQMDTISFNKKANLPPDKVIRHENPGIEMDMIRELSVGSCESPVSRPQVSIPNDSTIPLPPSLEFNSDCGTEISDIQRNLQNLYEYNILLREKFIASQSKLEALTKRTSGYPK